MELTLLPLRFAGCNGDAVMPPFIISANAVRTLYDRAIPTTTDRREYLLPVSRLVCKVGIRYSEIPGRGVCYTERDDGGYTPRPALHASLSMD